MAAPHVAAAAAAALVASVDKPTNQTDVDSVRSYLINAGNLGWTDPDGSITGFSWNVGTTRPAPAPPRPTPTTPQVPTPSR